MMEMTRTVGLTAMLAGCAWILQTAGLMNAGLLAESPHFFVVGAAIAGAGTGALLWAKGWLQAGAQSGPVRSGITR